MSAEDRAKEALDNLLAGGMHGAWLVRRDGLMALGASNEPHDDVTISAMTAAMAGAADVAMQSLGRGAFAGMQIDVHDGALAIASLDDEHLIVVLVPQGQPVDSALDAAKQQMQAAIA